jgi:hypothetical protein
MRVIISLLIIFNLASCSIKPTNTASVELPLQYQFLPSNTVKQDIDSKLLRAKENNKKLLLVLGAQWCHDSKGLATTFNTEKMQALISTQYELLFVDVGYLNQGFDVMKRFGMPIYYGTPTVMIIEPSSEKLLNSDSMAQWFSADSIEPSHYHAYFNEMAKKTPDGKLDNSIRLQEYYQKIEAIEAIQATRIKNAYTILGPALKDYKENNIKFSDELTAHWQQIQKLRYQLPKDITSLKLQAKRAVSENKSLVISLPNNSIYSSK